MRLAILHLTHYSVPIPPLYYGGSERVAWWLANEQSLLKHIFRRYFSLSDVQIAIIGVVDRDHVKGSFKGLSLYDVTTLMNKTLNIARDWSYMTILNWFIHKLLSDYDILIAHSHVLQRNSWLVLPLLYKLHKIFSERAKKYIAYIVTLHYDPPLVKNITYFDSILPRLNTALIAISKNQYLRLKKFFKRSLLTYIHNGIPVERYPFCKTKDNFYLYLGAIHPLKGPHIAIKVARKLGLKLYLAGPIRDHNYFNNYIKPYLGGKIHYLGEVDEDTKLSLLSKARALLFPVLREEYFGLVVVEAMACGTPVIAFARGALPEIIIHGKTGFLTHNICEFVEYIKLVDSLDPAECRRVVESEFSVEKMTLKYLMLYRKLVKLTG